ncbi:MAG: hypothetical protein J5865_02070 [Lachnospiraceae bacterium]|nr:hypothetical protein [Lachnospiraceae bacterium]
MADLSQTIKKITDTPDYTESFSPQDIQQNKAMGILAYISILVLIPIFAAKNSPYAKFHANQGLLLLIAEAAVGLILGLLGLIPYVGVVFQIVLWTCEVIFGALSVIGIVHAVFGKAKELPFLGGFYLLK